MNSAPQLERWRQQDDACHNTPLERGRGRSSARTRTACRFPRTARTGPKVRDWPLIADYSPNEETGLPLNDETRFP